MLSEIYDWFTEGFDTKDLQEAKALLESWRRAVMDFSEIVDQVDTLLQQRGRLTYRALKREFELDEEQLEALKERTDRRRSRSRPTKTARCWCGREMAEPAAAPSKRSPSPVAQLSRQLHASASGRAHPRRASGAGSARRNRRRAQDHHRPVCRSQRLDGA